jgi:prepilin peptidase CpaA
VTPALDFARLAAVAIALVAAGVDVRTRRIPNVLTFGGAAAAIVFHLWTRGLAGAGHGAGGWLVGVALLFPVFAVRGLGAGDVKLLGAVGAWLGPSGALWSGFFSVMAGGVLALVVGAARGYLGQAFRNLWALFAFWRAAGLRPQPGLTVDDAPGPRLAYGVAIAAGTLATVLLGK